ncbi:hypothetical protein VIGAN_02241700 [Vigna angularis var. angularis]|uniref:Uncharacterized protein n=1 Tax=Vigna angularis var. angularis TaxID=157739 RepID=A0A0S3RG21_PHAAN|nr:hypothetical protein VIGAN_02241700 [Vigna angularis var. angularis]
MQTCKEDNPIHCTHDDVNRTELWECYLKFVKGIAEDDEGEKVGGIICEVGIEEWELYCRKACVCEGVVATWDGTVNKKEEKVEGTYLNLTKSSLTQRTVRFGSGGDVEKGGPLMGMCREWANVLRSAKGVRIVEKNEELF